MKRSKKTAIIVNSLIKSGLLVEDRREDAKLAVREAIKKINHEKNKEKKPAVEQASYDIDEIANRLSRHLKEHFLKENEKN